jgi:hypothetical protein
MTYSNVFVRHSQRLKGLFGIANQWPRTEAEIKTFLTSFLFLFGGIGAGCSQGFLIPFVITLLLIGVKAEEAFSSSFFFGSLIGWVFFYGGFWSCVGAFIMINILFAAVSSKLNFGSFKILNIISLLLALSIFGALYSLQGITTTTSTNNQEVQTNTLNSRPILVALIVSALLSILLALNFFDSLRNMLWITIGLPLRKLIVVSGFVIVISVVIAFLAESNSTNTTDDWYLLLACIPVSILFTIVSL